MPQQAQHLNNKCQGFGFALLGIVDAQDPVDASYCQIALIGQIGDDFWAQFAQSPEYLDHRTDSLDRYSARILRDIAPENARLIMPSDQPYAPFQQWAQQIGHMYPSPLGLLIHAEYGLWFAFRGALRFPADTFAPSQPAKADSPCISCVDKPCLQTCPVHAFSATGFAAKQCQEYLNDNPTPCSTHQCQARLACPVGAKYRYGIDSGNFFINSFAQSLNQNV